MAGNTIGSTALFLSTDSSKFDVGLDKAEKRFKRHREQIESDSAAMQQHGIGLKEIAEAVGVFAAFEGAKKLTQEFAAFAVDCVKVAADVEDMAVSFKTLTGDAETGSKLFHEIEESAKGMRLTLRDAADVAKTLLSEGVADNQIIPTMRALGDLALGDAEKLKDLANAYAKVRDNGAVTERTLRQFQADNVFLTKELAKQLKVVDTEIHGLAKEGKIPFSALQGAIIEATSEGGRFFHGIEARAGTLNGILDGLKLNWEQLKSSIGEALIEEFGLKGFFDRLSHLVENLNDKDAIRSFVHELAEGLKVAADVAEDFLFDVVKGVAVLADAVSELGKDLKEFKSDWSDLKGSFKADLVSLATLGFVSGKDAQASGAFNGNSISGQVDRFKEKFDELLRGGKNRGNMYEYGASPVDHNAGLLLFGGLSASAVGGDFGKAAAEKMKQEWQKILDAQEKTVRGLREEFNPLEKIARELKDLEDIRKLGGFDDKRLAKELGGGWLANMFGKAAGENVFAFAVDKLFRPLTDKLNFSNAPGAAEQGSSEAVGAIINAKNAGLVKPEEKLLAAIKAQETVRAQQLKAARETVDLLKAIKLPGVF